MSEFVISKGTSKTIRRQLVDQDGDPVDLTGYTTLSLYVGTALGTATASLTISKSLSLYGGATGGTVQYAFAPSDTSSLNAQQYYYEIEVVIPAGTYKTYPPAIFRIEPTVEV